MKLSDAIICGSLEGGMEAGDIDHCVIGVAATAVGIPTRKQSDLASRLEAIFDHWPWLAANDHWPYMEITSLFDLEVCSGERTLEQLVEWIHTMEPSCPTCCDFHCDCIRGEMLLVEAFGEDWRQLCGIVGEKVEGDGQMPSPRRLAV